jgi:phospholipase A1
VILNRLWLITSIFALSGNLSGQETLGTQGVVDETVDLVVSTVAESPEEELKTEKVTVDIIADEEFSESMHQYPGLIEKIQTERLAANNPYVLLPHKPNYFMPLTYQTKVNQDEQESFYNDLSTDEDSGYENAEFEHYEFVFQLSVKYIVAENILGKFSTLAVAYTNKSFWQSYNKSVSAIFRETNHEPEIILGFKPSWNWVDHMTLAFNHQSNGQIGNLSRSWNRIIVSGAKVWPDRIVNLRAWYRMPETSKADPADPSDNDNPDIDDYLGYGDVFVLRKLGDHTLAATIRNNLNPDENKGSIELNWTFPLPGKLKGFVQYFNGYGESLIDYNQYQERIGVGIKIADWL